MVVLRSLARKLLSRPVQAWYDTSRGSILGGRAACRVKDRSIGCRRAGYALHERSGELRGQGVISSEEKRASATEIEA